MKLLITITSLFILSTPALADEFRKCGDVEVNQVQVLIDADFLSTHKSVEEYVHIFCRKQNCYRAYDFETRNTGGSVSDGGAKKEISLIKCTSDRTISRWETITAGLLSATFNYMKKRPQDHPRSLPPIKFKGKKVMVYKTGSDDNLQKDSTSGAIDN